MGIWIIFYRKHPALSFRYDSVEDLKVGQIIETTNQVRYRITKVFRKEDGKVHTANAEEVSS